MPPRKRTPAGPTPVDAITHDGSKRTNIPTADAHDLVKPELRAPIPLRYPRDTTLDPQLVWTGKDEQDAEDLVVDAPPLYIQEKVDPRVLIEDLRRTGGTAPDDEPTLFETFDGVEGWQSVEYYQHAANWSNRMILGDSLQVMASLAERENLRGQVQMIYFDPPYGIDFGSNWQTRTDNRDVKDRPIDATREVEQIRAFRDTWDNGVHSYLAYLRDRLGACRDLLTPTGTIFVQMGDDNAHLVRALLDEVFGATNFVGQIAFNKTSSQSTTLLQSVFDLIFVYARDIGAAKYRELRRLKRPGERGAKQYVTAFSPNFETWRKMTAREISGDDDLPDGWRVGRLGPTTSQGFQEGVRSRPYSWDSDLVGIPGNAHWKYDPSPGSDMDRLRTLGRLK